MISSLDIHSDCMFNVPIFNKTLAVECDYNKDKEVITLIGSNEFQVTPNPIFDDHYIKLTVDITATIEEILSEVKEFVEDTRPYLLPTYPMH